MEITHALKVTEYVEMSLQNESYENNEDPKLFNYSQQLLQK